jgi:hypothetical protein
MNDQWRAIEHYRLHAIEEWPDSPRKTAALAAIRSTLESLVRYAPGSSTLDHCTLCQNRTRLFELPKRLAA